MSLRITTALANSKVRIEHGCHSWTISRWSGSRLRKPCGIPLPREPTGPNISWVSRSFTKESTDDTHMDIGRVAHAIPNSAVSGSASLPEEGEDMVQMASSCPKSAASSPQSAAGVAELLGMGSS
jgi:hypothetical protein